MTKGPAHAGPCVASLVTPTSSAWLVRRRSLTSVRDNARETVPVIARACDRRKLRSDARRVGGALTLAVAFLTIAMADAAYGLALSPTTVTVSDFAAVVLSGGPATTTATMSNFSVTDSDALGWHVTVQATRFAEVDGGGAYVTGGRTLPVGSLAMPAPTVSPANSSVSVAPGPYLIDGATVQIATAATGISGTFDFTHSGPLSLSIPSNAYARSYRSEITVSLQSGP